MYYFGKRHNSRGKLVSILFRFIIGSALALLILMHVVQGGTAATNFVLSPWILPTVTLAYGLGKQQWIPGYAAMLILRTKVIALDHILIWASNKCL